MNKPQITVIGSGFVGTSMAAILSQNNIVKVFDIDIQKVNKINSGESPIFEPNVDKYFKDNKNYLSATNDLTEALTNAEYIIIAVPTNFNEELNCFDTDVLEDVISKSLLENPSATIVIKSTIPVGFTEQQNKIHQQSKILYSPEFLREGSALEDNLYPSRIIVGGDKKYSEQMEVFAILLRQCSLDKEVKILYMSSTEAESVKLFSNTYLAMRVAFFNELDSFALNNKLSSLNIISGVSEDKRIGNFYNNPSFGYGGYCLPKDSKQLLSNFKGTPQNIIESVVFSNETRKFFLADHIATFKPNTVGIYRLVMKENSTNFRNSAIQDLIINLLERDINIVIYEPIIEDEYFLNSKVIQDLEIFKNTSDLILANREHSDLDGANDKVFTRDLFNKDT
jgi:UDPglucose 6-dehydrogenase